MFNAVSNGDTAELLSLCATTRRTTSAASRASASGARARRASGLASAAPFSRMRRAGQSETPSPVTVMH